MPKRAAKFRCRSAAGSPKTHAISAAARLDRIAFKELI
jgi:hypothetical protein